MRGRGLNSVFSLQQEQQALFTSSVHRCHHRRPASLTLGIYFLPCFEGGVCGEGKKKASSVPLGTLPALCPSCCLSQSPAFGFGLFCSMTCIVKAKRQCNNTAWGQKDTLYLVLRGEGRYNFIGHPPFLPQPPG